MIRARVCARNTEFSEKYLSFLNLPHNILIINALQLCTTFPLTFAVFPSGFVVLLGSFFVFPWCFGQK